MRPIALVLLCALLSGCFTYSPARSAPGQAARVRLTLTSPADFRLADFTANEVVVVEGEIVRADTQEVVLSALELRARSGYEFIGQGATSPSRGATWRCWRRGGSPRGGAPCWRGRWWS
jgi:hypothetical protein